jgi:hypothetical protein
VRNILILIILILDYNLMLHNVLGWMGLEKRKEIHRITGFSDFVYRPDSK